MKPYGLITPSQPTPSPGEVFIEGARWHPSAAFLNVRGLGVDLAQARHDKGVIQPVPKYVIEITLPDIEYLKSGVTVECDEPRVLGAKKAEKARCY
jgi:hypothetical protein